MQAYDLYMESTKPTHEAKIREATAKFRSAWPLFKKHARMVRRVVANMQDTAAHVPGVHPLQPKTRSGRPKLIDKIGRDNIQHLIEVLKAGHMVGEERRAYAVGKGLSLCSEAAHIMDVHGLSPASLLRVLKQADSGIIVRRQVCLRRFTAENLASRKDVAEWRLATLAVKPNWHDRVFMLDTSHKFMSQLLQVSSKVITHKANNLAATPVTDARISWRKIRVVWLTAVNSKGGGSPLVFCPGTTSLEGEADSVSFYN